MPGARGRRMPAALVSESASLDPWSLVGVVLGSSPEPIAVCGRKGQVLYVNDAFRRVFGRSAGVNWMPLHDPSFAPAHVRNGIQRAFDGAAVEASPFWSPPAGTSGSNISARSVFVSLLAAPVLDGDGSVALVVLQFTDCTQQQAAQAAREQTILERDALLEQSPQGIVIADADGGIRLFNRAAANLWGGNPEAMLIADWHIFRAVHRNGTPFAPEDWPLARSLATGEVVVGEEIEIERLDGNRGTVLNAAAPLRDGQGRIAGGVSVFSDITRLKEMERQRDRFITVASHELRTPLTTLLGYTQLLVRRLQRGDGPEQLQPSAVNILRAGRRLDRLVNQLVDVSRLDQGEMTLHRDACDLAAVMREVIDEIAARDARIEIRFDAPPVLAGIWDAGRVEQAVYSLLDNAVRYGARDQPIVVRLRDHAGTAEVSIENAGDPVDPALIADLFQRFDRPDQNNAPFGAGLGLGLRMTQAIVAAHGGTLTAEPRPGGGLIVGFMLLRNPSPSPSPR